jgi:pimeloyl-ACP methyl ester carboxylesterase
MLTAVLVLLACMLLSASILYWYSPGTIGPYLDQKGLPITGSISEKLFLNIGGVRQGMFISGKDLSHPVMLYLHGGMPDYFLSQKYPTGLDEHFTMVWWEQRGSGISYNPDQSFTTITLDQMINDVLELTQYLRQRFDQEKIYLMGHSGGTFIGIQAAAKAPELYHAYIGIAQMSDQLQSEKLAYAYMLKRYSEVGNQKMIRLLEAAPVVDDTPISYLKIRDRAMHELGIGTTHDMRSVITGIFLPSLTFRRYTITEKINLWRGKSRSGVASLWHEMLNTNLMEKLPQIDLPVYFFSGIYDYTVSCSLSEEYYEKLQAPSKGYYIFEKSAHSPLFEEPEKMVRILLEEVIVGGS